MTSSPIQTPSRTGRRSFLTLLLGFCLLFAVVMVMQVWKVIDARRHIVGDGHNVESYGFDLSNLTVPPRLLVASGSPRDGQTPLLNPTILSAAEIAKLNEKNRRKYTVSEDEVIGVTIGGESRVYPIYFLRWHEIVNDVLGGVPIAVTYSPLCDAVVVFDRRPPEDGGKTLTFGYSGLLYNSNLVMYDRAEALPGRPLPASSLWSQLKFEAIAGPSVGKKLTVLPMFLGAWADWFKLHPDATGMQGLVNDPSFREKYRGGAEMAIGAGTNPYREYFRQGELRFPVEPLPIDGPYKRFDRVVARLEPDGQWRVAAPAQAPSNSAPDRPTVRACWFAWYAMHHE